MTSFLIPVLAICLSRALSYDINYPNKDEVKVVCESAESWNYVKIGEKHYFIGASNKVSWFESAHLCRQFGGDLALIESAHEMNDISNYLQKQGYDKDAWFWISGNDLITNHKFLSITNGLPLPFTAWSAGQPDFPGIEHCVHLWLQGSAFQMNNWKCDQMANYICQRQNYTRCRDIY